ncbi:AIPR family protein [Cypionkella sp.]|uniref:AIPR family protein n=1 Tax=Cypionkella sp. TaxID=2811411 RepID=UPI0027177EBF|nr:AIPR family protein [Cypionkella sp.]MDO8985563.1 AIPR family protein [Cypionkella sp.]MDP2048772.1 AIPR family protein [Cypionkella sp.]
MRNITQLEYSLIQSRVELTKKRNGLETDSRAFAHVILESMTEHGDGEISPHITDGGHDRGADAVYIQEKGGVATISIFQFKYATTISSAQRNFPGAEIDKICSLISDIMNRASGLIASVNGILAQKINDIWGLVDAGTHLNFKIFLSSNTNGLADLERKRLSAYCADHRIVTFEEISHSAVISMISADDRIAEAGTLDCIDLQKYERSDGDIRGVIANIDAGSFVRLICHDDLQTIKRHIFYDNIRGFLGIDGGYNKQIEASALADDSHLFWYLNNGITIIAKDFSHQPIRGSKIHLTDFQIVNGAQTSYSLFEAYKVDPVKVSSLVLLVKIFASSRTDVANSIAIATNSQARIGPRDLRANDAIQKKIEAVFLNSGILYERKKNQYSSKSDMAVFDSLKLGQAILAYHIREPHRARTSSDEIFSSRYYNEIFSDALDANYLVLIAKLFIAVSASREFTMEAIRAHGTVTRVDDFSAYSQWHMLFCISLLARRDQMLIPPESDFPKYIEEANAIVSKIAISNQSFSYYKFFRSPKAKELIQAEIGSGSAQLAFDIFS